MATAEEDSSKCLQKAFEAMSLLCFVLVQDILKGSGKLVDNHTVKYSLPGRAATPP